ncbi:MAG: Carbohydrate kinase, YjeF related protein [Thermotoga sp. 50_1627]|uniref:NAD(P)H-hydrate dehydratase n=1 Tax=Pseudothermotoga sp. TaxID=2033661 RepID=UPI00076C6D4E|nr:MAG: Carbohydrate kinase, YjeF related protein [Thermotoga sp. 50_64]KUK25634.1 MAG: Carbohydrate kinase, YjeF related protein [Thermotoga sp. 50_1627]MBC7115545.1 NAD(P)H-hydrate dehydratase [Pseudothermotoga sp.]MDK2923057.1 ADP-dependent NAD(P)H-hydrate dehydratase / NAD(P)H-hydrate epimerase [Pseudothermotoga sp.]HBT40037.1 bifunctional ADP-dependent NAD(P)H-hydrate dehydratase/NAD(P)H-hydrate epimerase [Pseudothermotoga sp.]
MKIISNEEMRALERLTEESLKIPASFLMERAGLAVVLALEQELGDLSSKSFLVLCGTGNNGGDGLVVARNLLDHTDMVSCVIVGEEERMTNLTRDNLERLRLIGVDVKKFGSDIGLNGLAEMIKRSDVLVDALLGTGSRGEVRGPLSDIINLVNLYAGYVVSVDLPSGLECDTGRVLGMAIKANLTVTFVLPKPCHVLFPGRELTGKLKVANIGIPRSLCESMNLKRSIITKSHVKRILPERKKDSHKKTFGTLLVVAGSRQYLGAPILTCLGALRSGCGYVRLLSCEEVGRLAVGREPGLVFTSIDGDSFSPKDLDLALELAQESDAIVLGPGLTNREHVCDFVMNFLVQIDKPVLIDADGLNCISKGVDVLNSVRAPVIITPHPGEFARLVRQPIEQVRYNYLLAEKFALDHSVVVVLKGATTIITDGKNTYYNLVGNTSLAKAGSGDVLSGVIGGFLAQGVAPMEACVLGVYVHGLASEKYSTREGTMLVSELVDLIPYAVEEVAR